MPNHRIKLPEIDGIVDGQGELIGFATSSGESYFTRVLGSVPAAAAHTGTTAKTKVGSIVVPGGCLGPNGMMVISPIFSGITNNANNKTLSVELGGVQIATLTRTTQLGDSAPIVLRNKANMAAQSSAQGAAVLNTTVNTANDLELAFYVTLATGTDSVTFQGALVETTYGG